MKPMASIQMTIKQMTIKVIAGMGIAPLVFIVLFANPLPVPAGQGSAASQGKDGPKVVYVPPKRGAPDSRVGAGSRGIGVEWPVVSAVAPEHTGLTVREQPTLFWFLSKAATQPLRLTITEAQGDQPLIDTRIIPPSSPGIQGVRLADYGVRLLPGVHYRWRITLVPDPDHPSGYIYAGGAIERAELPETLSKQLVGAGQLEAAALYAKEGFWYDAVTTLSEMIHAAPRDPNLRAQRAGLLAQVGLPEAAAYDMSKASEKK